MSARALVLAWHPAPPQAPDVPWDWTALAACQFTDPEVFFPEKGGSVQAPKRVCQGCEVRAECLDYAVENGERWGIWGGLTERERRPLLAARWPGTERCAAGCHPLAGDNLLPGGKCLACSEGSRKAAETRRIERGMAA